MSLATDQNRQPPTVEHGAPLRLLAPMKIGLKNIKAITQITYSVEEPADYSAIRGYSKYQGIWGSAQTMGSPVALKFIRLGQWIPIRNGADVAVDKGWPLVRRK